MEGRYGLQKRNILWRSWEYHFQDCGKHELWWMDPVLSDLLIFQYSEQKAPKALLTDSAIVSPRLYLHKNRERHFLILKECTGNFCANNVNQMHKGSFINYRRHWSLKWHFSYILAVCKELICNIGDHQIPHKIRNLGCGGNYNHEWGYWICYS